MKPSPATTPNSTPTAIGRHVLMDLYGVRDSRLTDAEALTDMLIRLLDASGFHRLGTTSHQFPGSQAGATAMVLLSESHATIHTYPEHEYAAVDVFSCGDADLDGFLEMLIEELSPSRFDKREAARGDQLSS